MKPCARNCNTHGTVDRCDDFDNATWRYWPCRVIKECSCLEFDTFASVFVVGIEVSKTSQRVHVKPFIT